MIRSSPSVPCFEYCPSQAKLEVIQKAQKDFYLIIPLGKGEKGELSALFSRALESPYCQGIVFDIDPNAVLLDRLFFLRFFLESLERAGKSGGIWGIPECILYRILGPWNFYRLKERLIPPQSASYCRLHPLESFHSSLPLGCRKCHTANNCPGPGNRAENLHSIGEHISPHSLRRRHRELLFKSDDPELERRYRYFCNYVDRSDLTEADRYLYFAKNLNRRSDYIYTNRFIYHCDYLPFHKYDKELRFLESAGARSEILEHLAHAVGGEMLSRYGYSDASRDDCRRESLYMAPATPHDLRLLKRFGLPTSLCEGGEFWGIGIDYFDNERYELKLYILRRTAELLERFPHYLQQIPVSVETLHHPKQVHVLRFNASRQRLTERIDLIHTPRDRDHFIDALKDFPFNEEQKEVMHTLALGFDFLDGTLSKSTLYYRNRF